MRGLIRFFTFVGLSLILAIGLTVYLFQEFLVPMQSQTQPPVRMTIPLGTGTRNIAQNLQDKGIVRHAWSFALLAYMTRTNRQIQAGTYDLPASLSAYDILKKLTHGETVKIRVTLPEGYTVKQIAELLDAKGIVRKNEFLQAAQQAHFTFPGLHENFTGWEGFLFPDTYDFSPGITPQEAAAPMLDRFQEMALPVYQKSKKHIGLRKAITLASMIEREGKLPAELPIISGVYYNRLKKDIPLQCDATIQYLLPNPKELLTLEDLKLDSPYNTYLHSGLPPGPIGNPGLPAIKAALFPAQVPYLYYVAKGNGAHTFSATYHEHLNAVGKYQQWILRRRRKKP